MAKKKSNFFIDRTKDAIFGVASIGIIQSSGLPAPIKSGAGALIGVKILQGYAKGVK